MAFLRGIAWGYLHGVWRGDSVGERHGPHRILYIVAYGGHICAPLIDLPTVIDDPFFRERMLSAGRRVGLPAY